MRRLTLALLALVSVFASASTSGCSRSISAQELVGSWVITSESQSRLPPSQRNAKASFNLGANSKFGATEIPEDLLYGPPEVADRLVTGSGDWNLVSRNGRQEIQLNFNVITSGQRGGVPYGTQLDIQTERSGIVLFYHQGDPDQHRVIEFRKQ